MRNSRYLLTAAMAALTSAPLLAPAPVQAANIVCAEQERCYGVARAGKNDCATASSACAGTAKQDNQKDAWVYVPKGTCQKVAGGSMEKPEAKKK